MIPLPIAVWRCSCRRSMAATRSSRLRVGDCTTDAVPAKETMPMRTSAGCSWTNAFAASCAAASRLGSMSAARMLSETSMARMMVRCSEGSVITALGRAIATIDATSASRNRSGGKCRRNRCPGPMAALTRLRLAYRIASFFLRRNRNTYAPTSAGAASNSQRASGHRNFIAVLPHASAGALRRRGALEL